MKHITFIALIISAFSLNYASAQADGDDILGVYENPDADRRMEIYKDGDKYFGKLVWLKDETTKAKVGDQVLKNLTFSKSKWSGSIYLPAQNRSFPATATMPDKDTLRISGKAGFTSRSKDWKRVTD